MSDQPRRPAPTRTDSSNAFAHHSMKVRVPDIIEEVQRLNPDYSPEVHAALARLSQSIRDDDPIAMIDLPAPDYAEWTALYAQHTGSTWLNSEWFFAEFFFYRHLIQAVRWWETGRDPFAPKKAEEVESAALWDFLRLALDTPGSTPADKLLTLLQYALWGNRIDLSYAASREHGSTVGSEDLLVNDSEQAVAQLLSGSGPVHLVADNAGTELAADLALIAALLELGIERVILHLKLHPIFVSDATVHDLLHFLDLLETHGSETRRLGESLRKALTDGRLRLAPDLYWNMGRFLWDLPPHLLKTFEGARLVILKGDANYRRAVGDAIWLPHTPFAEAVSYFQFPLLALRTTKSDPVVGLPEGLSERLDQIDANWHLNGRRGLIQYAPQ